MKNRVLLVFFAVFALVARSDGILKCHMCSTSTDPSCEDPSKGGKLPPVECSLRNINEWNSQMRNRPEFREISKIFDVDHPDGRIQNVADVADVACAKMTLKLEYKNVTLRSCQSATSKSATLNVCTAIRDQLVEASHHSTTYSMSYCDLCHTDACNGAMDLTPPKMVQLFFGSVGLMLIQAYRYSFA